MPGSRRTEAGMGANAFSLERSCSKASCGATVVETRRVENMRNPVKISEKTSDKSLSWENIYLIAEFICLSNLRWNHREAIKDNFFRIKCRRCLKMPIPVWATESSWKSISFNNVFEKFLIKLRAKFGLHADEAQNLGRGSSAHKFVLIYFF